MNVLNMNSTGEAILPGSHTTLKFLVVTCIIIIVSGANATSQPVPPLTGKALFETRCVKCHGADGTKGRWGAKNLHISTLSDAALLKMISEGKGIMPKWGKKLTPEQINTVIGYIKTLRN